MILRWTGERVTAKKTKDELKSARISAKHRAWAEALCEQAGERLTPPRLAAYAELAVQKRPLTAYELLACLEKRQDRKIAPLTAYRHLDFLMQVGLVHRLESNQSYLPCSHPDEPHESCYLVCRTCGSADELESQNVVSILNKTAKERGFETDRNIVELEGTCKDCIEKAAKSH